MGSFSTITSVFSGTPCISRYKSNYSNIRIFCIIRIFEYWFHKKRILFVIRIRPILISEYYSLFVFVLFSLFVATLVGEINCPTSFVYILQIVLHCSLNPRWFMIISPDLSKVHQDLCEQELHPVTIFNWTDVRRSSLWLVQTDHVTWTLASDWSGVKLWAQQVKR